MTCGNVQSLCPGHAGHVELCVPLMHPLFFPRLLVLAKLKCLACHDFRLGRRQSRVFAAKLHLADVGRTEEALGLDAEVAAAAAAAGSGQLDERAAEEGGGGGGGGGSASDAAARREADVAAARAIDALLDAKLALRAPEAEGGGTRVRRRRPALHERTLRRRLLREFQAACTKAVKCANCRAFSPKVRHDQFNKVFRTPLSERCRRSNAGERVKIRSAAGALGREGCGLEEEEDSEDEGKWADSEDEGMGGAEGSEDDTVDGTTMLDDEAMEEGANHERQKRRKKKQTNHQGTGVEESSGKGGRARDKFMSTLELEAQCRLTWERQPFLCRQLFGAAHCGAGDGAGAVGDGAAGGHSIFFLRAVPVPPSRFRPPVLQGTMTLEHAQNFHLSKILELNAQLRGSFRATAEVAAQAREAAAAPRELARLRAEKDRLQAASIALWVELQTALNCLMDSSRDPAGTAATVNPGIRQLLEKKEGIFRKHMMGKRVDHACRSVISPDPYIGTNEVGLPLHFARTLTFPAPVNAHNLREMQALVRRGTEEYPGAAWVEFPNGARVDLGKMKARGRNAVAARLLGSGPGSGGVVKVGRQLRDGDMVLMNRQVSVEDLRIVCEELERRGHGKLLSV